MLANEHNCVEHFRAWLRLGFTGCQFAMRVAAAARINYPVVLDELESSDVPSLEGLLDDGGAAGAVVVVLFPRMRHEDEIARMLEVLLTASVRWQCRHVAWKNEQGDERAGSALLSLDFTTQSNDASSVMGFAPLGTMPVTRRAPFVGLALWTGTNENKFREQAKGKTGFVNVRPVNPKGRTLAKSAYDAAWSGTQDKVGVLLSDPPERSAQLRRSAFCLSEAVARRLLELQRKSDSA